MNSWSEIIGQPQAVKILQQAVSKKRLAPAYLFVGIDGVGRRTTARVMIANLLGKLSHPDLLWIEPTYAHQGKLFTAKEAEELGLKRKMSPQIRIEQIREVGEFVSRLPLLNDRSLVVIEGAETMAEASANALLKTLEEPGRAVIILIAPSVDRLLPTLVSRCQQVPFRPLSLANMQAIFDRLGVKEIPMEILLQAEGSVGRAIQSWQILQTIPPELLPQLPSHPLTALQLAKAISALEIETQLWLVDYWQRSLWQKYQTPELVQHLEQAKQYLRVFVQPRLVWEVALLKFCPLEKVQN
ncbi:MAG: DNA polymerase III subunit delta' [Pseudanabaenaceae cyanobacterium]